MDDRYGLLVPTNERKPWTPEDVRLLRALARDANVPTDYIASRLGRSAAAVRSKAHRRRISLRPKNR